MRRKYVYRYSERSKSDTSFTICTSANEKEVQFPEKFSPRITDAFQNGNFQIATCFVASSSFTCTPYIDLKKAQCEKRRRKKTWNTSTDRYYCNDAKLSAHVSARKK